MRVTVWNTLVPENRAARFNSAQRWSQAPIWYRFQLERRRYPGNQKLGRFAVRGITLAGERIGYGVDAHRFAVSNASALGQTSSFQESPKVMKVSRAEILSPDRTDM